MPKSLLNDLLNGILEETHILKSALEAEDMDVVENSLELRQGLIEQLENLESLELKEESAFIDEFLKLDQECKRLLEKFLTKLKKEEMANKSEQRELRKNKKAHGSYQMQVPEQLSGLTIDNKK